MQIHANTPMRTHALTIESLWPYLDCVVLSEIVKVSRKGLKIQREQFCVGSSPAPGTSFRINAFSNLHFPPIQAAIFSSVTEL